MLMFMGSSIILFSQMLHIQFIHSSSQSSQSLIQCSCSLLNGQCSKTRVHSSMFKFMFKYNVQVQCSVFKFNVRCSKFMSSVQSSVFNVMVQSSMFMFMFTVHSSKFCVPCSSFTFQCSFSLFNFVMMLRCRKCMSGVHLQVLTSNGTASEYNFTGTIVDCNSL